jgi:hypothetical protein
MKDATTNRLTTQQQAGDPYPDPYTGGLGNSLERPKCGPCTSTTVVPIHTCSVVGFVAGITSDKPLPPKSTNMPLGIATTWAKLLMLYIAPGLPTIVS